MNFFSSFFGKSKNPTNTNKDSPKTHSKNRFDSKNKLIEAIHLYVSDRDRAIQEYGLINDWDVSQITDMSHLFENSEFNEDISRWNVSKVTDMSYMFKNATNFNQPIGDWNVSKVRDMSYMFENASSFNQLLTSWNLKNVERMNGMFKNATSFDEQDYTFISKQAAILNQPKNKNNRTEDDDIMLGSKNRLCLKPIITEIYLMSLTKKPPTERTIKSKLDPLIRKYREKGCRMVNLFERIFREPWIFDMPLILKYLSSVLTEKDKEETHHGRTILDIFSHLPESVDKNNREFNAIYNSIKPSGYQSDSPISYEEDEHGAISVKEKNKKLEPPDYEIVIYMHGGLYRNQMETINFPFRRMRSLVSKGNSLVTLRRFNKTLLPYACTYEDIRLKNDEITMEKMVLSINSTQQTDSEKGIFLYDKRNPESNPINLLSVNKDTGFIFINDKIKMRHNILNKIEMETTLKDVINWIVQLLSNTSFVSNTLGVSNFNFKKSDIIVYACREFIGDNVHHKTQYVKISRRPRTYLQLEENMNLIQQLSSSSPKNTTLKKISSSSSSSSSKKQTSKSKPRAVKTRAVTPRAVTPRAVKPRAVKTKVVK